jgi:membrane protease subunit (stomatin/prohibitin family)
MNEAERREEKEARPCRTCGAEVGEARFCPECGEAVEPRGATCPECGHVPECEVKFCPECGAGLGPR